MRILLDAQLPRSLVRPLEQWGCDVLHTLDLLDGNRSADNLICSIADRDGRVVFSKDADFVRSHLCTAHPQGF
jgi:predicted nuclease of predicted toxin-antitoxin system